MRVPLAIRGPGIRPGTSDALTHVVDLFPTLLELAGLGVPETVPSRDGTPLAPDGRSLAPVLFEGARQVRDAARDYVVAETLIPLAGNEL